jgi:hypothetical protein
MHLQAVLLPGVAHWNNAHNFVFSTQSSSSASDWLLAAGYGFRRKLRKGLRDQPE